MALTSSVGPTAPEHQSQTPDTCNSCNWCRAPLRPQAIRCPHCDTWQQSKWRDTKWRAYGPVPLVFASAIAAVLTPLAIGVFTVMYQQADRAQDATRTRLDKTFNEVKDNVDKMGE